MYSFRLHATRASDRCQIVPLGGIARSAVFGRDVWGMMLRYAVLARRDSDQRETETECVVAIRYDTAQSSCRLSIDARSAPRRATQLTFSFSFSHVSFLRVKEACVLPSQSSESLSYRGRVGSLITHPGRCPDTTQRVYPPTPFSPSICSLDRLQTMMTKTINTMPAAAAAAAATASAFGTGERVKRSRWRHPTEHRRSRSSSSSGDEHVARRASIEPHTEPAAKCVCAREACVKSRERGVADGGRRACSCDAARLDVPTGAVT